MSRKAQSPRPGRVRGGKGQGRGRGDDTQQQKSKEPQDWYHYCLYNCGYFLWPVSPTQSITNGDRTDNSEESSSVRAGFPGTQERSRSREHSGERSERRDRGDDRRDHGDEPLLEPEYGVIQTQPRPSRGKKMPRRHTIGGTTMHGRSLEDKETDRSKEAVMDMLAARYPQYAEKISSTASEDGFPVRGRSRDPRRRATVAYNPQHHNRSMDYEGTMSEVDGPTFHRGGFIRSSLPATRSPSGSLDKPPGLIFLIFRDETKKALLPNEITHLDTVRALFVRSFPGKLTMSFLESPKRKIYILEPRTNIYYQLEDLRDIKNRTVLRVHECDSMEPQRVLEKPEVRGRTIHMPPGSQGYYGGTPSSAITSQVQKTHPAHMSHPIYMSHDDVTQSPVRTSYERSRSLTPDPMRSASYAQNPIYGRMGISPERPPPPQDRTGPLDRPPTLRTIPENYLMLNGNKNGFADMSLYQQAPGGPGSAHRAYPRQAMSPPAMPTGPRMDPGRRAFSPPPNLQNYEYVQVIPSSQVPPGAPGLSTTSTYMAKGVRATTVISPQRATSASHPSPAAHPSPAGLPPAYPGHAQQSHSGHAQPAHPGHAQPVHHAQSSHPGHAQSLPGHAQKSPGLPPSGQHQQSWRERSPVGRHALPLSSASYAGGTNQQRSQSYRVAPTSDPTLPPRPRSMTPSPMDQDTTRDRIDKMEHQLANLAAWVQTAVVQGTSSTGAPSSVKSTSTSSVSSDTSPLLDSATSKIEAELAGFMDVKGLTDVASDGTAILSQDMKNNILAIKHQADALRSDLHSLRRLQQINKESILETVDDAWKKIREALSSVPGAEHLLIRQQRNEVDVMYQIYLEDRANAEKELSDLEHAVEELRSDVLSRQCRVQMSDVEGMALVLSHVTKALGDLKVRFPKLQERLKFVMSAEMEVIVREEKFLKEEPEHLDNSLKKCKKLTGTLFTLKRLASVQEHRPPQQVALTAQARMPTERDKRAVLENIQAMIPDHEARVQGIQAAETARQRKKKITTQQEALRFGKTLELASKALKPSTQSGAVSSTHSGGMTAAGATADVIVASSLSAHSTSDASSISFVMPMSTSTPKSASQHPTSHPESSTTSSSISYPVMSLIGTSPQQRDHHPHHEDGKVKVHDSKGHKGHHDKGGKSGRSVEFKSEPAILPVTSTEEVDHKSGSGSKKGHKAKGDGSNLSTQKSAARAAFFSSLSSPTTPTTTTSPLTLTSAPSTESPTELHSRSHSPSSGSSVSPIRGVPSLVRSSAVTMPSSCISTTVVQYPQHANIVVPKPSSLPVSSGSSVVSSQKFSPASPSNSVASGSAKSRAAFTGIPKPYSPTKSTPSPLTPESPKYRIPPSLLSTQPSSSKRLSAPSQSQHQSQVRDSGAKPKKVPPPPPPRKSSRLPGQAVLVVNAATANGHLTASKQAEKSSSKSSITMTTKGKSRSDLIEPPKQFANLPLDTKVERKSSIGSLKQFTTPLLESKRDLQASEKKRKESGLAAKQVSASNLDTEKKTIKESMKDKQVDLRMEADINANIQSDRDEPKVVKDTNVQSDRTEKKVMKDKSAETDSKEQLDSKSNTKPETEPSVKPDLSETSIDSSSSSSSIDSQQEVVWQKRKEDSGEQTVTKTEEKKPDQSQSDSSVGTLQTTEVTEVKEKTLNGTTAGKKAKPTPPQRRSSLSSKPVTETDLTETTKSEQESKTDKRDSKNDSSDKSV